MRRLAIPHLAILPGFIAAVCACIIIPAPLRAEDLGPETEVITNKEFKASQKKLQKVEKKKSAKDPAILPSVSLISQTKKHLGKTFRIMITGEGVMGIKPTKTGCDFQYMKLDDGGFGAIVGDGRYYFEAGNLICHYVSEIEGQDVSSLTLKVKFVGLTDTVDRLGRKATLPLLEALERE